MGRKNILIILILLISIISTRAVAVNIIVIWLIYLALFITSICCIRKIIYKSKNYIIIKSTLLWMLISIVHGLFVADNYWAFKSLVGTSIVLLFPIFIYLFSDIRMVSIFFSGWLKYALPLSIVLLPIMSTDSYGIYLAPISFLLLFYKYIPTKWKIITIVALLISISDFGARSILLKFGSMSILGLSLFFRMKLSTKQLNIICVALFLAPITFLALASLNIFNIFKIEKSINKKYEITKRIQGEVVNENLLADTRTAIYQDVIMSSITNQTVLFGTSPASGAEVRGFTDQILTQTKGVVKVRTKNEIGFLNMYMWCGIIGAFLFLLIYAYACHLAINHSKNYFVQLIGLYIAIRWIIFWIEDIQDYYIDNILLYIFLAICYSPNFRQLSNRGLIQFIQAIVRFKTLKQ